LFIFSFVGPAEQQHGADDNPFFVFMKMIAMCVPWCTAKPPSVTCFYLLMLVFCRASEKTHGKPSLTSVWKRRRTTKIIYRAILCYAAFAVHCFEKNARQRLSYAFLTIDERFGRTGKARFPIVIEMSG
jgi:hypothetical protein